MNNKTFSLFISSTFSDFFEERVALNKKYLMKQTITAKAEDMIFK